MEMTGEQGRDSKVFACKKSRGDVRQEGEADDGNNQTKKSLSFSLVATERGNSFDALQCNALFAPIALPDKLSDDDQCREGVE
jgi:hypothetical protein